MNLANALFPVQRRRATMRDTDGWWVDYLLGGRETAAGERVNPHSAMAVSAYFAAIRNISQDLSKLPLKPYRPLSPRGSEVLRKHPSYRVVHDQPNADMTAVTFWETIYAHALSNKGGFAEIVLNNSTGAVEQMYPIDPDRMKIWRNRETRELVYEVHMDDGGAIRLPPRKVLHINGLGLDGITAYVIAHIGRESIGGAMAAQTHSSAFFKNGAVASGIIEFPNALKGEALKNLRESFEDRYKGAGNHYKTVILEQGGKFTPVSFDAQKSQLNETREFTGKDVCRWFRISPNKLGYQDGQPRANVEQDNISHHGDTLLPWMVKGEQECARKLFMPREQEAGYFFRHVIRALLRGDMQQQATFFQQMIQNGVYSPDDVRELLDENPIRDGIGDTYLCNGNMIPLDVASQKTIASVEQQQSNDVVLPDMEDDAPDENERGIDGIKAAHVALLRTAIERLCGIETERIKRAKGQKYIGEMNWDIHAQTVADVIGPMLRAFIGTMNAVASIPLNGESETLIRSAISMHMSNTKSGAEMYDRALVEAKIMVEDIANAYHA